MREKPASFSLESYKVKKLIFLEPDSEALALEVKFEPSGRYQAQLGRFFLSFDFFVTFGEKKQELISVSMEAQFKFDEAVDINDLPDYFYRNSIAIIFPYLRAFISTVTSVANTKPLILPLLNLTTLEDPLRKNTTVE